MNISEQQLALLDQWVGQAAKVFGTDSINGRDERRSPQENGAVPRGGGLLAATGGSTELHCTRKTVWSSEPNDSKKTSKPSERPGLRPEVAPGQGDLCCQAMLTASEEYQPTRSQDRVNLQSYLVGIKRHRASQSCSTSRMCIYPGRLGTEVGRQ